MRLPRRCFPKFAKRGLKSVRMSETHRVCTLPVGQQGVLSNLPVSPSRRTWVYDLRPSYLQAVVQKPTISLSRACIGHAVRNWVKVRLQSQLVQSSITPYLTLCSGLAHEHASVILVNADSSGRVSVADVEKTLSEHEVALVSIMWANNEIGAIQPVHEIANVCKHFGVPFHTDAVQALGQVPLHLPELDAAAVTLSSHKIGGPVGVGALIVDSAAKLTPILHGGGQEREVRSGTLDPASISAFAAAVRFSISELDQHAIRLRELQQYLVEAVIQAVPDAILNGPPPGGLRLPNNTHFSFPGCEGDSLLMLLDAAGIDCSTGSACTAGIPEPSHVLLSMGVDEKTARASLRFSLGRDSSREGIDQLARALPVVVERAQRAGSVSV